MEKFCETRLCSNNNNNRGGGRSVSFNSHFNQRIVFNLGKQNDNGQLARKSAKTSPVVRQRIWQVRETASKRCNTFGLEFHKFK